MGSQTQSPIAGFVFETKRGEKICTISGFGDSITEGRGTYINAGWGVPMCEKLGANFPDVSFSWANMGWSGQGVTEFVNHQSDAFAADLVPDVCFFPNGSPNTAAIDGEVTDPRLQTMADRCADMQSRCLEENIPFVIWTWLPTDPVVPNMKWGASDAKRIAYNLATLAEGPKRGCAVADFSAALAGSQDSAGQTLPRQGAMVDGVHPSDAGNAELKDIGAAAAVAALARAAG
ncbi:MAG: SGNH/GDSL hydrolase family protein [Devosia sp.]